MIDRPAKTSDPLLRPPALALSNAVAALIVGLLVCQLTIAVVVGLPLLLAIVLVSEQGDAPLLIALCSAALLGTSAAYAIGGALGKRRELHWAFVVGPLGFAAQMLFMTARDWGTSDLLGRTMLLPYIVATAALAVGFFLRRRQSPQLATDEQVDDQSRPA